MVVLPAEGGSPVTKSSEISDHGRLGMDEGCSRPIGDWVEVLFRAQVVQAATYSVTSFSILGQQNLCFIMYIVRLIPG